MRLAHVDGQEIRAILVVIIDLNDVANLAPEGRSSETPKYQYQRTRSEVLAKVKMARAVQRHQSYVRRVAAHIQSAAMHMREGVPHHPVRVLRTSRHVAEHAKRRYKQHSQDARRPF